MAFSGKKRDVDLTSGSILRQMLNFSLPMAAGLLFQHLYNAVDTIVVGQFVSTEALAAVGSTGPLINTLVGFANGLSLGSTVVISQSYGAKDEKALHTAVHTTMAITFIVGLIVSVLGLFFAKPLLVLMDTPETVMPEAYTYLMIYFAGVLALLIYNMGSGILRAVGDSKRPLYFLIVSAILNVVGDLLFVIVFKMGVAGVAYATILAQLISAVLVLVVLTREKGSYGLRWKEIRLEKEMFKRIFRIGMPTGIQQAITAFSNLFVQSYINYFGATAVAGYSVYSKLDAFLYIPLSSISSFNSTFVGQNYGAGKNTRAREGLRTSIFVSCLLSGLLAGALILMRNQAMELFTSVDDVKEMGSYFIMICSPFYMLNAFFSCYVGSVRGTGDSKRPMLVMLGGCVVARQIYLAIVRACGNSMLLIVLGYPFGWLITSILSYIMYRHSRLFLPDSPSQKTV